MRIIRSSGGREVGKGLGWERRFGFMRRAEGAVAMGKRKRLAKVDR
jgi:hypothetical protein